MNKPTLNKKRDLRKSMNLAFHRLNLLNTQIKFYTNTFFCFLNAIKRITLQF